MKQLRMYEAGEIDSYIIGLQKQSFTETTEVDPDDRAEYSPDIRFLPYMGRRIAEIIGSEATLTLAKKCKHRCLYIPRRRLSDNHFLIRTIGRELSERLQWQFQGELISFPLCTQTERWRRDAAIRESVASGKTRKEIAAEFKLSKRHVENILNPKLAERNRKQQRKRRRRERLTERKPNEPNSLGKLVRSSD